jgi:hypothetical protein
MYYILEIANIVFNIYDNKNGALVHLYKLSKYNNNCQLKEFNSGCIEGIFNVKKGKIIYTHLNLKNDIIEEAYTDIPFELKLLNNKTLITCDKPEVLSSDINVQLPSMHTEINISSDKDNKENNDKNEVVKIEDPNEGLNMDELKRKIEELNKLKDLELNDLENLNDNLHDFENKIIEEKFSVDAEKNKLRTDKEKWEEFKNIFAADKKIYKIMKEQLNNNEIEDIPELFERKYPIFKVLDDNNLLNIEGDIYEYIKLLPEDDSVYIPKNIALKGLFNDNNGPSSISLTELKENNNETTVDTDDES